MTVNVLSGIVRIVSGRHIGTGFVVTSDGLILTCAHVLGSSMPEKAGVVFLGSGEEREATVLAEGWRGVDAEDVAVLCVCGALPEGVQPLPLGSSQGIEGHALVTFGYPETGEVEGIRGTGTILGHGTRTKAGQPLLQLRSSEITAGFSGAPVWDEVRQRVVGMVVIAAERDALGKLSETAFATPTETLRAIWPALQVSEICPYRNLEAFTEVDAALFFGRQRVVDTLVDNLQNEPRFLAVFGASGSGKSSVVQAGLIPQLRNGVVPGSDRWEIIVTRPLDSSFKQLLANLSQAPTAAALVIDQFEELFVSYDEAACAEAITQLTGLLERSAHVTLIIVMRDDFYSLFVQHEALAVWLKGRVVNVWSTMKREEVEAIVREPATAAGWQFEDGLVETMVNDALETSTKGRKKTGSSTILPLLEFALTELWERRQDGVLTSDAYRRIGGVTGGLTRWANEAYSTFDERLRPLVRRVFTDLVHLGNEEEHIADSRRRRSFTSLVRTNDERVDIDQIVQRLVNKRLLVTSQENENQQVIVEIIHDALLWEWGLLRQWVEEDRRFLTWHQELERPVHGWTTQHDKSKLLRGRDLSEAERWFKERRADLDQDEVAFLRASAAQHMRFVVSVIAVFLLLVSSTGIAGWGLTHQSPKQPDPRYVTNLQDDGVGSLRWAIAHAPAGSTITFNTRLNGDIIKLNGADIHIEKNLKIVGPGADILTISSINESIYVDQGFAVTISGLAFKDSKNQTSSFINNQGTLTLTESIASGDTASGQGGGIYNSGTLTLTESIVSGDTASGQGGGIYNSNTLILINSMVSDNTASGDPIQGALGGGIYNNSGMVTLTNSTISGNTASGSLNYSGQGGGIYSVGGMVTLTNSKVLGNTASRNPVQSGQGGGIYNIDGMLTLTNSTISGNTASSNANQGGQGGGIYNYTSSGGKLGSSMLTLTNSTVSGNTASGSIGYGGGIFNLGSRADIIFCTIYGNKASVGGDIAIADETTSKQLSQVRISNSIVASDSAHPGPDISGTLISYGHNLFQYNSGATFIPNKQHLSDMSEDLHADLGIVPVLRDNGGPTNTLALLPSSPAIDNVPLQYCQVKDILNDQSRVYTDQRGMRRPDNNENACDIGAYESSG